MNRWLLCKGALLLSFSAALLAQQVTYDGHEFDNEQQRRTREALIKELRCPKCQNQNIADLTRRWRKICASGLIRW